ncbi:MAG: exonuclease domain-containing protein [Myxococcales bacterium]|nr:exonuclease domain-containing protein [Myxococcales bacterium]
MARRRLVDVYFSADVETDGPIPGPYSMLSFGLVLAGTYDGLRFVRPEHYDETFYRELRPIADEFEEEALRVNGLDRDRLAREGTEPNVAMTAAAAWVRQLAAGARPVLVAYPLSFDWTWLYWYFVRFGETGSPFNHSSCFDLKTAFAVKSRKPIAGAGRHQVPEALRSSHPHSHHALDDAIEQAIAASLLSQIPPPRASAARAAARPPPHCGVQTNGMPPPARPHSPPPAATARVCHHRHSPAPQRRVTLTARLVRSQR